MHDLQSCFDEGGIFKIIVLKGKGIFLQKTDPDLSFSYEITLTRIISTEGEKKKPFFICLCSMKS